MIASFIMDSFDHRKRRTILEELALVVDGGALDHRLEDLRDDVVERRVLEQRRPADAVGELDAVRLNEIDDAGAQLRGSEEFGEAEVVGGGVDAQPVEQVVLADVLEALQVVLVGGDEQPVRIVVQFRHCARIDVLQQLDEHFGVDVVETDLVVVRLPHSAVEHLLEDLRAGAEDGLVRRNPQTVVADDETDVGVERVFDEVGDVSAEFQRRQLFGNRIVVGSEL